MKKLSLVAIVALSVMFSGCGDSSSNTDNEVEVERGKVYGAMVTDSSSPIQTATQKVNQNIYIFTKKPIYPVKVTGGWIDIDGDGKMTNYDMALDMDMVSYSNVITPITTYIADNDKSIREQKLLELAEKINLEESSEDLITSDELLKIPSKSKTSVIVISNAIYKSFQENSDSLNGVDDEKVLNQYSEVKSILANNNVDLKERDSEKLAMNVEKEVIENLFNDGKIDKLSEEDIPKYNTDDVDSLTIDDVQPDETSPNTDKTTLEYMRNHSNEKLASTDCKVYVANSTTSLEWVGGKLITPVHKLKGWGDIKSVLMSDLAPADNMMKSIEACNTVQNMIESGQVNFEKAVESVSRMGLNPFSDVVDGDITNQEDSQNDDNANSSENSDVGTLTLEKCQTKYENYTNSQWAEAQSYGENKAEATACYQALVAGPLIGIDGQLYIDQYNKGAYDAIPE